MISDEVVRDYAERSGIRDTREMAAELLQLRESKRAAIITIKRMTEALEKIADNACDEVNHQYIACCALENQQ